MDVVSRNRLMLFSGSANRELAEEVSDLLGVNLGGLETSKYANDEISRTYVGDIERLQHDRSVDRRNAVSTRPGIDDLVLRNQPVCACTQGRCGSTATATTTGRQGRCRN